MGLLSLLHKKKQKDTASDDGEFYSRAEEDSKAARSRGKRKQSNQGAEQADPVLPQKKRARRRLVGAIALVLAAVIGLPMILDSEPKPLSDDIAIQIPSKNKPAAANTSADTASSSAVAPSASLDQKEKMANAAPPAPSSAAAPVAPLVAHLAPATSKDEPKKEALVPSTAEKPSGDTAVVTKKDTKSEAKPDTKPEHVQANKNTAKPVTPSTSKADDAARAEAILEGKAGSKPVNDKKAGKFVIQVAALASKDKIDELQAKLKHAGIHSYTEKIHTSSGERTRIRVGPFADKEDAEKSHAKLVRLGLSGAVVPAGN
jgi:DedD protein